MKHDKFAKVIGVLAVLVIFGGMAGAAWHAKVRATEQPQEVEAEPGVESAAYTLAKGDYSNLTYDNISVDRPVYDRYTLKQRLTKGLPTMLPALPHYTAEKVAYLTFDDGPDDVNTPAILDVLKAKGVHATFYVLGGMVEKNPAVLKRIFTEGHAIGNHSYDHDYERLYANKESFVEEMEQTDEAVFKVIGMRPFIIRAPGGTVGMFADDYYKHLNLLGYVEHDWNVLTEDATPEQPSAEQQIDYIDRRAAGHLKDNMALVLMHCNGGKEETVRALPGIIDNLKAKGYRFGVVTPITPQPW
ncbi:polysaccharide deacetylase family protein [Selenomonas ruminantium]|uniref:Peptidoglycan/xylan/chitin deacetylase, PgdA/CDA1 family n=1 Tax=Selenomonas ruminantium TaxID=971 RepID=A0A1H3X4X6_SELRU|nr:polysaccharide deacetylase family protein [Selenomonas ruminantium]SDZ94446.1 Peptidoglycan/xylan/chitin deacetylase, PgdA/CDA1 family [Selenomonas ruminantium]